MSTAAALSESLTNPMRIAMFSFGFQVNKGKKKNESEIPSMLWSGKSLNIFNIQVNLFYLHMILMSRLIYTKNEHCVRLTVYILNLL